MDVKAHETLMAVYQDTLEKTGKRITDNELALEKVIGKIKEETRRLEIATNDLELADADFASEKARWEEEVRIHTELMDELHHEMDALNQCIDIFTSDKMNTVSDDTFNRMNS